MGTREASHRYMSCEPFISRARLASNFRFAAIRQDRAKRRRSLPTSRLPIINPPKLPITPFVDRCLMADHSSTNGSAHWGTLRANLSSRGPCSAQNSKVELQSELDNPGTIACGDDTTEVASTKDLTRCGINASAGSKKGVEVADRIREVRVVEQIEKFCAKFEGPRFGKREKLCNGKIQIHLSRPAQTVPADVANISPCGRRRRGSTRTGNGLTSSDEGSRKHSRIQKVSTGNVAKRVLATHSHYKAGTRQWICAFCNPVKVPRSGVNDIYRQARHGREDS